MLIATVIVVLIVVGGGATALALALSDHSRGLAGNTTSLTVAGTGSTTSGESPASSIAQTGGTGSTGTGSTGTGSTGGPGASGPG